MELTTSQASLECALQQKKHYESGISLLFHIFLSESLHSKIFKDYLLSFELFLNVLCQHQHLFHDSFT